MTRLFRRPWSRRRAGDGRAAATSYNFLKGVTPGRSLALAKGQRHCRERRHCPEGFTKAGGACASLRPTRTPATRPWARLVAALPRPNTWAARWSVFINPGQVAANAALPNSRVLAGAAGAAADGALYGAYGSGVEQASRDCLDSGEVNSDHVWAAAKEGAGYGALLGGVLGGGISLIAEKGPAQPLSWASLLSARPVLATWSARGQGAGKDCRQ